MRGSEPKAALAPSLEAVIWITDEVRGTLPLSVGKRKSWTIFPHADIREEPIPHNYPETNKPLVINTH
jgi:hypothetical protein